MISPPALKYAGNVPAHSLTALGSVEMRRPTERGHEVQEIAGLPQYVGIDGSGQQWEVGRRGG